MCSSHLLEAFHNLFTWACINDYQPVQPRDKSLKANKKLLPKIQGKSSRFFFALLSLGKIYTDVELFAAGASSLWQPPSSSLLVYTHNYVHPLHIPLTLHILLTKLNLFQHMERICTTDLQAFN